MNEKGEITIKGCFEALSMFFILTVISLVMIYGKFEQGVEAFWENILFDGSQEVIKESDSIVNLDEGKISSPVSDLYKNKLTLEYMENGGDVDVFTSIFEEHLKDRT